MVMHYHQGHICIPTGHGYPLALCPDQHSAVNVAVIASTRVFFAAATAFLHRLQHGLDALLATRIAWLNMVCESIVNKNSVNIVAAVESCTAKHFMQVTN